MLTLSLLFLAAVPDPPKPTDADVSFGPHPHQLLDVYLPPAWYATNPPPRLPTVMMIGGEFNTPADWLRAGTR